VHTVEKILLRHTLLKRSLREFQILTLDKIKI
jgi:hypothetical protein